MYFMKHSDFRNQSPSAEVIPALNVNEIIYGCCVSMVMANKMGSWSLNVLKIINIIDVVWIPSFCSVFYSLEHRDRV